MTLVHLARTSQVLHESAMGESVDLDLRGFFGNGEDEFVMVLGFGSLGLVVASYQIEVAAAGCVYVMNHAACLFL